MHGPMYIKNNSISFQNVNKGVEYVIFGDHSRELLYALHNVRHINLRNTTSVLPACRSAKGLRINCTWHEIKRAGSTQRLPVGNDGGTVDLPKC